MKYIRLWRYIVILARLWSQKFGITKVYIQKALPVFTEVNFTLIMSFASKYMGGCWWLNKYNMPNWIQKVCGLVQQKKNSHPIRICRKIDEKRQANNIFIIFYCTVDDYFLILYEDWSIYLIKIFTHEITKIKFYFFFSLFSLLSNCCEFVEFLYCLFVHRYRFIGCK